MNYSYQKIAATLQQHVRQLQPGDFIEPERALAKQYAVSPMTMRQALNVLVKDGSLRRQRGKGSVVVDRLATGEFAVVLSPEMLAADASPFYRLTINALVERIRDANPRYRTGLHLGRAKVPDEEGFAATVGLLDPRVLEAMRGVISFKPLGAIGEALEERNIPVIRIGRGSEDWRVWFNPGDLLRQGIECLAAGGCRRPGLIWGCPHRPAAPEDKYDLIFTQLAAKHGMKVRPEWTTHIAGYNWGEQEGYDLFNTLWNTRERPDGLLVTDDGLCRGALRAITRLGVGVPSELQLISHANEGVPFPFHLAVTRLELSPNEFARQAWEMLLRRNRGNPPTQNQVTIPLRLVPGETC